MAFLAMPAEKPENDRSDYKSFFEDSVKEHLKKVPPYDGNDLYGARCGFLHSNTWEAQRPTREARKNLKWDYKQKFACRCSGLQDCLSGTDADLDDLWQALKSGIDRFFHTKSKGDELVTSRLNRMVEFWPVLTTQPRAIQPGSALEHIRVAEDFDVPLDDMSEYRE